jgi:hypothetical protein
MINTYMTRGKFPIPIQTLASGPIWTRKQIEDFRDSRRTSPLKGRKRPEEIGRKISKAHTGRKLSKAERETLKANRYTPEYAAKLSASQIGENNNQAKLTWELIRSIRSEYKPYVVSQQALADKYSVHRSTIADIVNNRIWIE